MLWRDVVPSVTEVTPPALEPVSRTEAKLHVKLDVTADDALVDGLIIAARRQVERDCGGRILVDTVFDLTFDDFPSERFLPVPRWPLQSVGSVKSYDEDDVESTFAAASYFVDTASIPGRIGLAAGAAWPSDLREFNAGIIRFTAGANGAAAAVSSITLSGSTATLTTTAAHGYATGNRVTIAGADQTEYNGTFEITVTGGSTFTYTVTGSPATPATGTITVTDLGIPENLRLAVLLLVGHWYQHRTPVEARGLEPLPLAYEALLHDRLYALA